MSPVPFHPAGGGSWVLPPAFAVVRAAAWLGIAVTLVTVPVLVYDRTGSALVAGLAAALEAAPYLLVGLRAGAAADRRPPDGLLRAGALASALVLVATSLAVASLPHDAGTVLLLAGTASVVALSAFGDAAGFAVLPRLVPRDRLARANGRLATLGLATQLAGPAIAAGLLAVGAGAWALLVHAGLLLLVAALSPLVRPGGGGAVGGELADARRATASPVPAITARAGVRFIRRHPIVGPLTLAGACNSVTAGGVVGVLAVYAHEVLGWAPDSPRTAALYAAISVGGLAASLLAPRLVHRHGPARVGVVGLILSGVGLGLFVLAPDPLLSPVWLVLWEAAVAAVVLNGIVVRQLVTPLALQGRVGITGRMVAWGTQPLGALAVGAAAQAWGAQVGMAVVSVGSAAAVATLARAAGRNAELRRPIPVVEPGWASTETATATPTVGVAT